MKIKNALRLAFGFVLAVGSLNVAMTKTNKTAVQTNAADVTTGSVLMNTNGNIRYISKGDNPDVWSSETSETLNYGRFGFNDFTNKGGFRMAGGQLHQMDLVLFQTPHSHILVELATQ